MAQLLQNYSILLKQQNNSQQCQLPKPGKPKLDCDINFEVSMLRVGLPNSRFPFATEDLDSDQDADPQKESHHQNLRAQFSYFINNSKQSFNQLHSNFEADPQPQKRKRNKKRRQANPATNEDHQTPQPEQSKPKSKQQPPPLRAQPSKLEDSDEIKAKHTDEIKEFERRLEAAHENLKDDQKLKLNFSKEWVKKMQ